MEKRRATLEDPDGKRVYYDPEYNPTASEGVKHSVTPAWKGTPRRGKENEQYRREPATSDVGEMLCRRMEMNERKRRKKAAE